MKKLLLLLIIPFLSFGQCGPTASDIEGPFYIPNSPWNPNLTPYELDDSIPNFLFITGTVYANDCETPIPNATVDVWHANEGEYDEDTDMYVNAYFFAINQYTQSISQLSNRLSFFSHHRQKVIMSVLLMNIIGASIGVASESLSVNDAFTLFLLEGVLTFLSLVLTVEVKDPLVNSAGRVRSDGAGGQVDENGAALLGASLGSGPQSC